VSKPVVVFTRPRDWATGGYGSDLLELVYVPISGEKPVKRNGRPVGDGIGDVVTKQGVDLLMKTITERQPDFFFHSIHAKVGHALLSMIRAASPKTKILVMDGNNPDRVSKYVMEHRSFVHGVLINSRDPGVYRAYLREGFDPKRIGTLYDGFVPAEHPAPTIKPTYDCFFAGSNIKGPGGFHFYQNGAFRQRFMLELFEVCKFDMHGYTEEWSVRVKHRLNYPEYYAAFHGAKIAVNVNHLELARYYTRRTIHAGASGRLYLVKYIPGMEEDFGMNGQHVAWFSTVEDGLSLVRHYLENEKEREEVAASCRKLFLEKHTWQARLKDFEQYVLSFV
jgi:hypothetical protein